MPTITLVTAMFGLIVAGAVFWANPHRFANLAFGVNLLLMTVWLLIVYQAMVAGIALNEGRVADPTPWLRANAAVVAFLPASIWLTKESILTAETDRRRTLRRLLPWLGLGVLVAAMCYTPGFIIRRDLSGAFIRGNAYYFSNLILVVTVMAIFAQGWRQMRSQAGIRRVELQFILLNFGITAVFLSVLNSAGNYFHLRVLNRTSIPMSLLCFAFTAWAVTFHRVFNARQVLLSLGQRAVLALMLAAGILGCWQAADIFLPSPAALLLAVTAWSAAALWLDRRTRDWFGLDGEEVLMEWRRAVIAIARTEPQPDVVTTKLEALLCTRCQTPFAALLADRGPAHATDTLVLGKERPGHAALCATGWATPETLQRRRPSPGVDDLRRFLYEHGLGVIIAVPRGSPTPSCVLALGTKTNRWPFTYPEVRQLQNVAELMDNILTHSRLAAQAALKAKMEHLALMSRGLAHDLKNLITPISTFIMHTDGRFDAASLEGEVHAVAKRSVRIMTEYVREALFFASRLTPRFEQADLTKILETVRVLTASRAAHHGVEVAIDSGNPPPLTADTVLLQRLLGNLVNNAIDASNPGGKVTIDCAASDPGRVRFQVVDDGCGIPAEDLARIFEPYFTTKQFGDEVRGFGLGLTICEKIVNLHQGTILVRSEPGRGTSVIVDLPAAPTAFPSRPEDAASA